MTETYSDLARSVPGLREDVGRQLETRSWAPHRMVLQHRVLLVTVAPHAFIALCLELAFLSPPGGPGAFERWAVELEHVLEKLVETWYHRHGASRRSSYARS